MPEFAQQTGILATHHHVVWGVICGIVSGVASMLLYGRFSPQGRLQELKLQSDELQQLISQFDGKLTDAILLARQNLQLSFRRLGIALVPSLWSGLPVVLGLFLIGETYLSYFAAVAIAALTTKFLFRIA